MKNSPALGCLIFKLQFFIDIYMQFEEKRLNLVHFLSTRYYLKYYCKENIFDLQMQNKIFVIMLFISYELNEKSYLEYMYKQQIRTFRNIFPSYLKLRFHKFLIPGVVQLLHWHAKTKRQLLWLQMHTSRFLLHSAEYFLLYILERKKKVCFLKV